MKKLTQLAHKYLIPIILFLGAGIAISHVNIISTVIRPEHTKDFAETSVKILNFEGNSGGSGVILKSSVNESIVLTNKHVCELIVNGGLVQSQDSITTVTAYKMSQVHDLCLIKVNKDLQVNTKVATEPTDMYENAFISGHPSLLPHVLSKGQFSGLMPIRVMVDMIPCTEDNVKTEQDAMYCFFMGGLPIIKTLEAQLVTGTILPGSSGSAVFNEDGEISGLVFAGNGDGLGYAFIVPHVYVLDFILNHNETPRSLAEQNPGKSKAKTNNKRRINESCSSGKVKCGFTTNPIWFNK